MYLLNLRLYLHSFFREDGRGTRDTRLHFLVICFYIKVRPPQGGVQASGRRAGGGAAGERRGGEVGTVGCGRRSEGRGREARLVVCVRAWVRRGRRSRRCGSAEEGGGGERDG